MRRFSFSFFTLLFFFALAPAPSGATGNGKPVGPRLPSGQPHATLLNINGLSFWASDDGRLERQVTRDAAGVIFPRGTSSVVNAGGLVWAGQVHDGSYPILRMGGQLYSSATSPGGIISPGIAESPLNADVRIYRIRRDWATADLTADAAEYFGEAVQDVTPADIQALRDQYRKDWTEWPWQKGAPYEERNGLPGYQPDPNGTDSTADVPGLGGADQVIWCVVNDLGGGLGFTPPIGLELQITCWAYSSVPQLSNVIFERYRLIYKGTATTPPTSTIDSMYIAKWVDPDIGNFSDDFVGSMPDRNIGFAYNAEASDDEFARFGLTPPVLAYDLLEGPRVRKPGSQGRWDLKTVPDIANLPMTAFTYFTDGARTWDYPVQLSSWWNIVRGLNAITGRCMVDPITTGCTKFELPGDPITFEGWVDGSADPPGDRRFAMVSGPFSLAFGDTQEVVLGVMAGIGSDNRDGINTIKTIDDAARDAFIANYERPAAIPGPDVRVVELDNKLILDWESDTVRTHQAETYSWHGYRFETYAIYQYPLPDSPPDQVIVYQHFDPSQARFVPITTDKIRNMPLVNGRKYYFAVTTIVVNPDSQIAIHRLESAPVVLECVPHSPNPGTVYPYPAGNVLSQVPNLVGRNDATVQVSYFDPSRPDGHPYKILFHRSADPIQFIDLKPTWDFIDSTTGDTLVRGISADQPPQRVVTKGLTVQIESPLFGMKGVYQTLYGNRTGRDPVFNIPNPQGTYMVVAGGTSGLDTIQGGNGYDSDVEWRFNGDSSWALFLGSTAIASRWVRVPYTAWEIKYEGNDSTARQLYTAVTHASGDSVWRPSVLLDRSYNGKTLQVFYPVTMINDSVRLDNGSIGGTYYDDAPTRPDMPYLRAFVWVNGQPGSLKSAVREVYIADLDGDGIAAPRGTVIRIERYKQVRDGEQKLFTSAAVRTNDLGAAKSEIGRVNVFPNPYYGFNNAEIGRNQHFVTFNHLPALATIRIYSAAGTPVRVIRKSDPSQFATWDLNNESGLPVAGGVYLAVIEMGMNDSRDVSPLDLGTRTLKLMVVPADPAPGR